MTDLEKHVNRSGRAKLVKQVREKINELGITYIYFQKTMMKLTDLFGLEGKIALVTGGSRGIGKMI
ncbi:MAG: hypothetical protein COB63_04880, partial [Candidatus Pelagibacter sp.]